MPTPQRIDLSATLSATAPVLPDLDPRLQFRIAKRKAGVVKPATASTGADEVAVVARVSDATAWANLSEVREPVTIGAIADNDIIVTGRLPIRRLEQVRMQPFVKSLKGGLRLAPSLWATTLETDAMPASLPTGHLANGGAGAVVGVIDYGGDFAHLNFLRSDGTTRFLSLWFQDGPTSPSSPFGYGKEFKPQDINAALQQTNPYAALGYDPADFEDPADPGSHGTHVLDIAAGNGGGTDVPGMAPNADIVFVNISQADEPTGTASVGKSFGDSVRLLEAMKYIFDRAGNRPCVINVSLGTNGGPHDGTTLVEQGIDSLLKGAPNRAVTIAASNSFEDGIHASGSVAQGAAVELQWQLVRDTVTDLEMEVWYPKADRFTVELIGPDGQSLATVAPGSNETLTSNGQVAVFIANRLNDPNNGDNMIGIFFAENMSAGTFRVRLHGDTVSNGAFHAWIERDNLFQSHFASANDNRCTIGSISCSKFAIAVGSYDGHKAARPISFFSSAGPTRDQRQKPEVSAPGHNVQAARSGTGSGIRLMSGTSMASPAVAGLAALVLAEAKARGLNLTIEQTRKIIVDSARKNPPAGASWDDRYGHGRINAHAAIQAVIDLAAAGPGTTPPPSPAAVGGNAPTHSVPSFVEAISAATIETDVRSPQGKSARGRAKKRPSN